MISCQCNYKILWAEKNRSQADKMTIIINYIPVFNENLQLKDALNLGFSDAFLGDCTIL